MKKTYCKYGHDVSGKGGRHANGQCATCQNEKHREYYANHIEVIRARNRDRSRLDRAALKDAIILEKLQKIARYLKEPPL